MRTILITGASGFVGTHLVNSFKNRSLIFDPKFEVDNILTPSSYELNLLDIEGTLDYFDEYIGNHNREHKISVVHLAADVGGILYNKNNPGKLIMNNLKMGINIFEACKTYKVDNLYYLGTTCSYPCYCPTPFKEDDIWNGPEEPTNSPYGVAKKTFLKMAEAFREEYGLKTTYFISANLFGPYDKFDLNDSHVIPALIRKFIEAKENNLPKVECWGTGNATREFLYAGDLAKILCNAATSGFDYKLPINVGTGVDISIKELAYKISNIVGYNGDIVFTGDVSDGQPKRQLDVSRLNSLGFKAETTFDDGLVRTIEWYIENRKTNEKCIK